MPDLLFEGLRECFDFLGAEPFIDVDAQTIGFGRKAQSEVVVAERFRLTDPSPNVGIGSPSEPAFARDDVDRAFLSVKSHPTPNGFQCLHRFYKRASAHRAPRGGW